jgi:hypothetical protein
MIGRTTSSIQVSSIRCASSDLAEPALNQNANSTSESNVLKTLPHRKRPRNHGPLEASRSAHPARADLRLLSTANRESIMMASLMMCTSVVLPLVGMVAGIVMGISA